MKCFVVILIAACVVYKTSAIDANVSKQACIRDVKVNPAMVEKAYNGEIGDARELKCYFKCHYENAGYINDKGEIQVDKLKANPPTGVNKDTANKAIDLCKGNKGKDACETSYLVQKCLLNNNVKY